MKTLTTSDRKFLDAVEAENAPGHDLVIEWSNKLIDDKRRDDWFEASWLALVCLAAFIKELALVFIIAAIATWIAKIVVSRVSGRRHDKQVAEQIDAFLATRPNACDVRELWDKDGNRHLVAGEPYYDPKG